MTRKAAGRKRAPSPPVFVIVEDPAWRAQRDLVATVRRAARLALAFPGGEARAATILLTGDDQVRDLNARFRRKRKPTNVLAFPAPPGEEPEALAYAGDVALAHGVVSAESAAQQKTLAAHAAHLTIHGVLHLLGYDHHRVNDAKAMETLEISLLRRLGFEDPYRPVPVRQRKNRNKIATCPTIAVR
jgi:probable rRNA maturation factor